MAFCYECGSEVAPDDIFCPFCGISLQPTINNVPEEEVQETEKSVRETEMPAASVLMSDSLESASTAAPKIETASDDAPSKDEKNADFALNETEETFDIDFDSLSLPKTQTPSEHFEPKDLPQTAGGGQANKFGENFQNEPESILSEENDLVNFEPINFPAAPESTFIEEKIAESEFEKLVSNNDLKFSEPKKSEIDLMLDASGESKKAGNQFEPEKFENLAEKSEIEDSVTPSNDFLDFENDKTSEKSAPDFTLTIPDVPSEDKFQPEIKATEEVSATENAESNNEKAEDDYLMVEPPIFKPADNLDSHVSDPPNSQFDSVRIMENFDAPPPENKPENAESKPQIENAPENTVQNLTAAENSLVQPSENRLPETSEKVVQPQAQTTAHSTTNDTNGKKNAKLKPLEEGTILNNRYEVIRKIGGGGMGAVYLASDNNLGGVLRAVKEMVQSYIEDTQQEKAINDFKRESMILSTLDHVSIPTIYDYFYDEQESRFYLVMKYINGGDLSAKLRSTPAGKIDEKTVTEWGIQIADVLDYLHNRPTTIIYRDLKPANVMIDGNSGRTMLIDFGIARSVSKEEKGVTAVGTMGYAPPELFSGNVEPRSDIYSLGSTMFHLLTGADPQSNPLLIFDFQKNPRPRQINSQLSDQMERILMRSVEYNADSRFASAAEMRQALQDHLENLKAGKISYGVKEAPKAVSLENQPVFCGFCGQRIMATDMFCAFCGAKQPLSQQGVHSEIYTHSAATAKIMIVGTTELDSPVLTLEKDDNLIGRRDPMSNIFPEVDLSKFDPQTKISRRHARLWREGNSFLVEDLGSSNGTIVLPAAKDSVRLLPHQPYSLTNGDKIRVGDTTLNFYLG